MGNLIPEQIVNVGDIKAIPHSVSHSVYDAYMFLIEVDGKRTLHTGDFDRTRTIFSGRECVEIEFK